ncbi:lipopolysaccharide biosynthesis protein [uncultured Hymenobacter sp.]|uniref:lipopolysaccharide biosynthesis protein n=1 Tax=uncultured Hymenobacter sp. TaxID=170016 RepID=UPI0035C9CAB5
MGIVLRQGLRNTLISYVGLAIGFVNTTLILPRLLAPAQIGLTGVLISIATIAAQVAAFGFSSTTLRYFPYFRNREAGHSGFLPLLLGLPLLAFGGVGLVVVLARPLVLRWYAHDAALLGPHYLVAVGLGLAILVFSLLDAYLRALFHSAFSSFLQEVLVRLLIVAAAAAYGLGYLPFGGFVLAYLGAYALSALLLLVYLGRIGELHWRPTRAVFTVRPLRELLAFGGFALLGNISGTILVTIDALMVGAKLSLAAAGIYAIAFNMSTALTIPFRALYKTAFPLIAEYWKAGKMAEMAHFYRRSTRLNTVLGCYLALGIGLNLDFVYTLIHRPEYAAGSTAVLLLLLGRLLDGITGVNGIIVVTSPRYRVDLLFNISLAAAIVALNWLLIPRLGLSGAALGNCLALGGINLIRTLFVWRAYGLQPFDSRIPRILAVAAAAGAAAWALPAFPTPLLTLLARGSTLTLLYGAGLGLSGAAPELRALAAGVWNRVRG